MPTDKREMKKEIIKPTIIDKDYESAEKINNNLACALAEEYPKMFKRVLEQSDVDIDGTFLGFMDTYYYLSKFIPKGWAVVDFGCAYNPQAYYFRKHRAFIGVDIGKRKRFHFENTDLYQGTITDFLAQKPPKEKVFAICNNVPDAETSLVREYYPNCFVYYVT